MFLKNKKLLDILQKYPEINEDSFIQILKDIHQIFQRVTWKVVDSIPELKEIVIRKTNFFDELNFNPYLVTRIAYCLKNQYSVIYCKTCNQPILENIGLTNDLPVFHNKLECLPVIKKLDNLNLDQNVYYKKYPENFLLLKDLIEKNPLSFFNQINATGRKRSPEIQPPYSFLKEWINKMVSSFLDTNCSVSYKAAFIIYGLTELPKCKNPNCNKPMVGIKHYLGIFDGFRDYCCNKCAQKDEITRKSIRNTLYEHFGEKVKSSLQITSVKEKTEITNLTKFGVKNAGGSVEIQKKIRKRYFYNGIYFHSSPELAFYIYLIDHKISFQYHPSSYFNYEFNKKTFRYYPDFIVDGKYVEIKGDQFFTKDNKMKAPFKRYFKTDEEYETACQKYECKHICMISNDVIILRNKDYQKYLDYITDTYGDQYLRSFKTK